MIRGSKTWRKVIFVTWVVGLDSNFSGFLGFKNFFGESAAECEYAADFTDVHSYTSTLSTGTSKALTTDLFIDHHIHICLAKHTGTFWLTFLSTMTMLLLLHLPLGPEILTSERVKFSLNHHTHPTSYNGTVCLLMSFYN